MNQTEFDIVVLGGGCIGASILFHLAKANFKNLALIDKGRKTSSATASSGGMLRVFHENPKHVELALGTEQQIQLLQQQGTISEKKFANGTLYFFSNNRIRGYQESFNLMQEARYPFQILNAQQGQENFPDFKWHAGQSAVYEPFSGHMAPATLVDDLLKTSLGMAQENLDIFEDTEVKRISHFQNHYRLCLGDRVISTKNLILACGAKTLPRLNDLGVSMSLEVKTLASYFSSRLKPQIQMPNFFDRENLSYGRWSDHQQILQSDPESSRWRLKTWGPVEAILQAEESYAPNRLGYLGSLSGHPKVIVATGWGGTGFKFCLEIGRRAANILEMEKMNSQSSQFERNLYGISPT